MLDLVIIGSGPYGISLAAHAVANGLSYKLLGYPMDFWKNTMPQDMFIRTPYEFIQFSDPNDAFTITRFSDETGAELVNPLPRPTFVQYAMWFAEKAGIEFTSELVVSLERKHDGYRIVTDAGQILCAKNVVVATGVEHYKYVPELYRGLPSDLISHTSGYTHFDQFAGQKVAVIGSGQSAWEAAGLLHLAGTDVQLIYRRESANYAGGPAEEIALRDLGDVFYDLPMEEKQEGWGQSPGSVAHFLRPYVEGKVPEYGGLTVVDVQVTPDRLVELTLSSGETRTFHHLISASGFRINIEKVPFFGESLLREIDREDAFEQFPKLSETFESSVPGLYIAGPLSSHSHGPTFRFILGLKKTASTIIPAIASDKVGVR
ncbi:NAD(P)/FAD-dependent oxidoreductase [Alicyclobacillus dauci]|uniref:NAD(P)-binding domain-containing protein n=1 Tax=Alicyclobacillus dauci TaxID=1475485 RepID=A0ABY6Z5P1_9BACL|nr:NAD(P)-binding domain-containing protein [Alicyclobacillus dauci]WAH38132.1 NAD(P)-binding domain-containing protein [Alicyclobacillus dauci]